MWATRIRQAKFWLLPQSGRVMSPAQSITNATVRMLSEWTRLTGFSDESEPEEKDIEKFMALPGTLFSKPLQFDWRTASLESVDSESHWHGPVINLLNEVFPLRELYHVESQTRMYVDSNFLIPDAAVSFKTPYMSEGTLLWSKTRSIIVELKWEKSKDDERKVLTQLRDYAAAELEKSPHSKEILMIQMLPLKWRCFAVRLSGPFTGKDSVQLTELISWTDDPVSDRSFCELTKIKGIMEAHRPNIHASIFKHFTVVST